MINVTDFAGSCDSEIINNAIKARNKDGIVIIPPRECKEYPERDFWLLPASTHMYNIVIDNVVDTSPEGVCPKGGIIIGSYGRYGEVPGQEKRPSAENSVASAAPVSSPVPTPPPVSAGKEEAEESKTE